MIHTEKFDGVAYRRSDNWFKMIDLNAFYWRPIYYLEIGTFYGANLFHVAETYASHPQSTLFCVDPWADYDDYDEYKNQQSSIYSAFMRNLQRSGVREKIRVCRGYSNEQIPRLKDDLFDIIYIDGNHNPEYVLEDAVLCFRKLKTGGYMIFDDYGWGGPDCTQKGIDAFMSAYSSRIEVLGMKNTQVFIRKIR
jgi:hypothetical protein